MDYTTLMQLAEEHNIYPYQEEQRYRLASLLYYLHTYNMVFKGGTMIWFIHGGLRYSRDLDFNMDDKSERIDEKKLRKILNKAFGTDDVLKSYRESESFINAEVSFPGITIPLGIKIKLEITVPYAYIDEPSIHYFSFSEYGMGTFLYRVLDVKSIIADKINGLFKRKKAISILKDAFDLWFLMKVKDYSTTTDHINHIFSITNIKFDKEKLKHRLKKAKEKRREFSQYLLPSFRGDIDTILQEVYHEVNKVYETTYSKAD